MVTDPAVHVIHIGDEEDFEAKWEAWAVNAPVVGDMYELGSTRPMFQDGWWTLRWQTAVTRPLDVEQVWVARPGGDQMIYPITHATLAAGDTFQLTLQLEIKW